MTQSEESTLVSQSRISYLVVSIRNYLKVAQDVSANGISRDDVVGFESVFNTTTITEELPAGGFTPSRSKMGLDIALEGILKAASEDTVELVKVYLEHFKTALGESKVNCTLLKELPKPPVFKGLSPTARKDLYNKVFGNRFYALIENGPSLPNIFSTIDEATLLLNNAIISGFDELIFNKQKVIDFLNGESDIGQSQLLATMATSYNALVEEVLSVETGLSISFSDTTKPFLEKDTISLTAPLKTLPITNWVREESAYVESLKGESRTLETIPALALTRLVGKDITEKTLEGSDATLSNLHSAIKERRSALMRVSRIERRSSAGKDLDGETITMDVLKGSLEYTFSKLELMGLSLELLIELNNLKAKFALAAYQLKAIDIK